MKVMKKINVALTCGLALMAAMLLQACGASDYTAQQRQPAGAQTRPRQISQTDPPPAPQPNGAGESTAADSYDGHAHGAPGRVPRFASSKLELKSLPPVLAAAQFTGQTRIAYAAVKEMPETIAQLPCYCYCDEGFGHKSLHTCFTDEHAAHCAVCVEEALLASKLQKEERLNPAQIRERIIAEYGAGR